MLSLQRNFESFVAAKQNTVNEGAEKKPKGKNIRPFNGYFRRDMQSKHFDVYVEDVAYFVPDSHHNKSGIIRFYAEISAHDGALTEERFTISLVGGNFTYETTDKVQEYVALHPGMAEELVELITLVNKRQVAAAAIAESLQPRENESMLEAAVRLSGVDAKLVEGAEDELTERMLALSEGATLADYSVLVGLYADEKKQ